MDKNESKKSIWDKLKSLWNSLPGFVRFIGTILGIIIAIKALLPAAAMEISHFSASPEVIEPGDASILSWEVSGGSNITIEPGIGAVSSNGSLSVSPSQTTIYKLTASGKGGEKTASCTVTVKKDSPLINSFDASPNSIETGESAILNWHVAGASKVIIEPEVGAAEPAGTSSVSPAKTTIYKLAASNGDKTDIAYCTVTVEDDLAFPKDNLTAPEEDLTTSQDKEDLTTSQDKEDLTTLQDNPPSSQDNNPTLPQDNLTAPKAGLTPQGSLPTIDYFNANPDMISNGESSNLTWSVSSASKVSIEPGIGTVGLTGSQLIFPNEKTTYILTATNEFGSVDATKVVFVEEPLASVSPTPAPSVPLSTPKQLSPASGTVFDNSTSGTALEWTDISGAASYTLEIDSYDSSSGSWLSESAESSVISGINTTSYSLEFPAKSIGSGRWRVWAVGSDGQESKKSDWWNFNYAT